MSSQEKIEHIDTHMHTDFSNPYDWWLLYPMEKVMQTVINQGLSGALKTDHNTLDGTEKWMDLASKSNLITSPAVEISTATENKRRTPHIITVLPEWRPGRQEIPYFQDIERTLKTLRDLGSFIIVPHPVPDGRGSKFFHNMSLTYQEIKDFGEKGLVDAVEVTTPMVNLAHPLLGVLSELKILPIGASDAHVLSQIGTIRTHIAGKHKTVYDALQAGKSNQEKVKIESRMALSKWVEIVPETSYQFFLKQVGNFSR
jgi:hypothetical protein